ncbi:response regulator transcription factor [Acidicapsa dinghuensis]|uniref:Response regulator transcription factor n=1 Tax=Acidicapsa dinghuensis TaxID=2218256 RepID=A0ABW1EGY3_9BACT|nr:response regulator transcription factor [Acidicapsa dinghuensis]
MHVCMVEDDIRLAELVQQVLEENRHVVVHLESGEEAASYIAAHRFDAVLLDLMLPNVSGLTVLKEVRRANCQTPVIILSARDTVPEMVRALDIGADDYLTKPFHLDILLARLRSVVRRGPVSATVELVAGSISLDPKRCTARLDGRLLDLTRREYMLLETFVRRAGQVLTRDQLTDAVWGIIAEISNNNLDVHIHSLRTKLGRAGAMYIQTVRGIGYVLHAESRAS